MDLLCPEDRDLLPRLGYPGDPDDDFSDLGWYDDQFNWAADHKKPRPDWRRRVEGVLTLAPRLMLPGAQSAAWRRRILRPESDFYRT